MQKVALLRPHSINCANPIRRGVCSQGSERMCVRSWMIVSTHTYRNAYRLGCALPHAGLGYRFLRAQEKPNGSWGSSNGSEAQSASAKSTSSERQNDGVRAHLQNSLALYDTSRQMLKIKQVHTVLIRLCFQHKWIASLGAVSTVLCTPLLKDKEKEVSQSYRIPVISRGARTHALATAFLKYHDFFDLTSS